MPERQYAEVRDPQSRSPLSIDLHWPVQLQHRFFSHRAVLAETFDFENTAVGLKAALPQSGQGAQPFADGDGAGGCDGGFRAGAPLPPRWDLLEVLFDARVFK